MIKPETPAQGILKTSDFGIAMFYHIHCDCGSQECAHDIEIEADDACVKVHIYHTQHTKWWEYNRWRQIWHILTKGYAEMQTTIVLEEQTALNYSETLKEAMQQVKRFRESKK
jgi:hypothetical protein